MQHITSRTHPLFKKLLRLQRSSRQRHREGLALLDGIHLLQSYLATKKTPELLIVSEAGCQHSEIKQLLSELNKKTSEKANCLQLSDTLFYQISPVKTPVGVMALIHIPQSTDFCENYFCIMLETIQDPGNLGSILRSAVAAGVKDVFLSTDCADCWSPKTLRAGMGAHFSLRIHENTNLTKIASQFKGAVIATALVGANSIYSTDLRGPVMFVFGNEGGGISEELLQVVHKRVMIPMPGTAESLNVTAAAAICLFEKVRQEDYPIA